MYFRTDPDNHVNVNLNEFDGGILNEKEILTDSIIHAFTWDYTTYKKTIWVRQTKKVDGEIIDAIRYKDNVRFKRE